MTEDKRQALLDLADKKERLATGYGLCMENRKMQIFLIAQIDGRDRKKNDPPMTAKEKETNVRQREVLDEIHVELMAKTRQLEQETEADIKRLVSLSLPGVHARLLTHADAARLREFATQDDAK